MKARFRKVEQQTNERVKKAVARRRRFGYVGIRATSRPGLIVAIHNKRILGYFSDPAEAAAVYDEHARRIDGDQAVLNGPNADLSDLYRKLKRNRPRG
jgi:hypothetical protein